MLNKLLKYDLKWIYKVVIIFYALSLVFSVFARICNSIPNSLLFTIIGQIANGVAISMVVSSLINGVMRSWVRFIHNVYKDESYLTHTLPVDKKTIYLSKVLSAIICTFTTVIVIMICLFICYYSKENMAFLKQSLELTANSFDITVIGLLLIVSLVFFLEIVFIILIGYLGIIIGHRSNKNKMTKSIIYSFMLYSGFSILSLVLIYIVALFNSDIMNVIKTNSVINTGIIKYIMIVAIIIYTVYVLIIYYIGKKQLEKGVNVD